MPTKLDDLPDEIIKQIYEHLDTKTLTEVARTSKRHRNIALGPFNQRFNQTIMPFYHCLPAEIKSIVPASEFSPFLLHGPNTDLVKFMQNRKMTVDQLNFLAVHCYKMMWHFENPSVLPPWVPQISEDKLRQIDQDFDSIREDNIKSVPKLFTGISLASLALMFTVFLLSIKDDTQFANDKIATIFFLSYFFAASLLVLMADPLNEGKTLRNEIENMSNKNGSRLEYAKWLHFVHNEMTSNQHKLIVLENMHARDALRYKSVRIAANCLWGIYCLYFILFPLSGLAPIFAWISGVSASVHLSMKLLPETHLDWFFSDVFIFLIIYGLALFNFKHPIRASPVIVEAEINLYCSSLYALPVFLIYNAGKTLIVKTPDVINYMSETLSTARTWLPTLNRGFRYQRLGNEQRELLALEERAGALALQP